MRLSSLLAALVVLPLGPNSQTPNASADAEPAARPIYKSPLGVAVDQDGKRAYVALNTADTVAVVDLQAGKVLVEIPVGKKPHDVALAGKSLFVTCERDDTLVRIDTDKQAVTGRWKTGQSPRGVAAMLDGSRVFVACHDERTAMTVDPVTNDCRFASLPSHPQRILLSHRSETDSLLIALQAGPTWLSIVDIKKMRAETSAKIDNLTNPAAIAPLRSFPPSRERFFIIAQEPRTHVPATQVPQGWVFANSLIFLNPKYDYRHSLYLDQANVGEADPSDLILGTETLVASAGADAVSVVRLDKFMRQFSGTDYGATSNYLASESDLTRSRRFTAARLSTQSNPRRIALSGDGKFLVASNYLSDSLTVIDAEKLKGLRHISLGSPAPNAARRGEILFNSGKMTFQGQFTCASCHPGGGSDGLNWDLARDGIGNFLNTRSLLGVKDTAPYGWHGSSTTLADRVAGTLRTLHKHEPQGTEVADIVAYLKTLEPPRPLPQTAKEKEAAVRGQTIFEGKGKCIQCHRPPVFDDQTAHDIGTRIDGDIKAQFDTPSLRGVARTAPYLHHGQAETLEDVFTKHNVQRKHGAAHDLTPAELADLVAYLKSL